MRKICFTLLGLLGTVNVSAEETGWWRLELKTLKCHQESFNDSTLVWALAASGNPCTPIGDSSGGESFVMIECPRTGKNYILAPTKDSCLKAVEKIKPLHDAIKDSEGEIPFKQLADKNKMTAEKKKPVQVKTQAAKQPKAEQVNKIEGAWHESCRLADGAKNNTTVKRSFVSGVYSKETSLYRVEDKKCRKKLWSTKVIGSYKSGPTIDTAKHIEELDLIVSRATATPRTEEAAQEFTSNSYAGIMVWEAGQEQDITKSLNQQMPIKVFTVYRFDGGKLMISQDPKSSDKSNRKSLSFDKGEAWLTKTDSESEE